MSMLFDNPYIYGSTGYSKREAALFTANFVKIRRIRAVFASFQSGQARRQDFAAEGAKNHNGGHIF